MSVGRTKARIWVALRRRERKERRMKEGSCGASGLAKNCEGNAFGANFCAILFECTETILASNAAETTVFFARSSDF